MLIVLPILGLERGFARVMRARPLVGRIIIREESRDVRILVADDDRVISTLICGVLARAGHQATPVQDAMQALMFAMRSPAPELILLDVRMPGGTGVEALRKLKQSARTFGIPVLVVSGVDDPAMPQRMRELGALDVLPKPVDAERLLAAVDHAAGRAVA